MTMATCGTVTALTLGLPASCAIPEAKGTLPKGMFVAKVPASAKTKQHLAHDVARIVMLALLRPANTGLDAGTRIPEVLVMGLELADGTHEAPQDVVELIASQRKSGMLFACTRTHPKLGDQVAFAVRRALPGRAGHTPTYHVYVTDWQPAADAHLAIAGTTMDTLFDSLCSQVILGTPDAENLDERIARAQRITQLEADIAKLTADHQRAKNPQVRNQAYAKLHKAKQELEALQSA